MGIYDKQAKQWMRAWPNTTRTLWSPQGSQVWWLRAQPAGDNIRTPRLASPGSEALHTQPDGLWMTLGVPRDDEDSVAAYVDCVVIEACGTPQNMNDKRARYAARTTSLMVDMRKAWLDHEVVLPGHGGAHRRRRDVLGGQLPDAWRVLLPVKHLRVLYALPDQGAGSIYDAVKDSMVMEAHEFACPFRMLGQYNGPPMQRFLKRMAPSLQYM